MNGGYESECIDILKSIWNMDIVLTDMILNLKGNEIEAMYDIMVFKARNVQCTMFEFF
jgi:hypothetical protein